GCLTSISGGRWRERIGWCGTPTLRRWWQRKLSQNEVQLILQENCSLKTEKGYLQKKNNGLNNQIEKLENQVERLENKNERLENKNEEERQQARQKRQQARQERQNLQKNFLLIIIISFFFLLSCQFGFNEY
ncbi:10292_t:CDS:2, partial [Dentiscutata erythropus]